MIPEEEIWIKIVKDADTNKDGQIDFDEFKEMMLDIQDRYEARQKKRRELKRKDKYDPKPVEEKIEYEPDDDTGIIKQYHW